MPLACQPGEFACADDGTCIPQSAVCDGRPYCRDGSDEFNCPSEFLSYFQSSPTHPCLPLPIMITVADFTFFCDLGLGIISTSDKLHRFVGVVMAFFFFLKNFKGMILVKLLLVYYYIFMLQRIMQS